jgi:hypothetical protein
MGEEGLEPPTDYLEGSCSIQLSYSPALAPYPNILSRQLQQLRLFVMSLNRWRSLSPRRIASTLHHQAEATCEDRQYYASQSTYR